MSLDKKKCQYYNKNVCCTINFNRCTKNIIIETLNTESVKEFKIDDNIFKCFKFYLQ